MATVGTPWASSVWRFIPKIVDHLEGEFSNQSGCGNNVEARSVEQYQHYSLITLKCDLQARQVCLFSWRAWQKPTKIITITSVPWLYIMWCQFVLFTTSVCTSKIIDSWTLTFSASSSWALHSCWREGLFEWYLRGDCSLDYTSGGVSPHRQSSF